MRRLPSLLLILALGASACVTPRGPALFGEGVAKGDALAAAAAVAGDPRATPEAVARAGWVALIRGGDLATAVRRWKAAIAREPRAPLAWLGLAAAARARLDHAAAARAELAVLSRAPDDPLAELAVRWLSDDLGVDAGADADAARTLTALLDKPGVLPRVRAEARDVLAGLRDETGDLESSRRLEDDAGGPVAWTLAGPYSRFNALDLDTVFGPQRRDRLEGPHPGPVGQIAPRLQPAPAGSLDLSGEPPVGDVFFAVTDVTLKRPGHYLLRWQSGATVDLFVDGVRVLHRDAVREDPPSSGYLGLALAGGTHRVLARLIHGQGYGDLDISLLDLDGRPAPATWDPSHAEAPPPVPAPWPETQKGKKRTMHPPVAVEAAPPGLLAHLEAERRVDPSNALASWLEAELQVDEDVPAAKAVLAPALETAPGFAWARYLEARIDELDRTLPQDLRSGRAATAAEAAAKADPREAQARLLLARIAIGQSRYADARKRLDEVAALSPTASELFLARSRLEQAQSLPVLARNTLEAGLRSRPESCDLRRAVYDARSNDGDLAGSEAAVKLVRTCGVHGFLQWADDRVDHADVNTAIAAYRRVFHLDPTRLRTAMRLAELLDGRREYLAAVKVLERSFSIWPRVEGLATQIAQTYADAGNATKAHAWRERALRIDPSDLSLRRSLAFEKGTDLMAWGGLDLKAQIDAYEKAGDAHPGADEVAVVDHAAVQAMANAPKRPVWLERIQSVTQVLTKQGVDDNGEVTIPEGAQTIDLYVRKADGRILRPEPVPGKSQISMPNLEVGDYVVSDYIQSNGPRVPQLPGWAEQAWYVQVFGMPLWDSTYEVRAPVSVGLEVEAHNLPHVPKVKRVGDTLTWSYENRRAPALSHEASETGSDEFLPWFRVGAGSGPKAFGDLFGDFMVGHDRITPAIRAFAKSIVAGLPKAARADRRKVALAVAKAVDAKIAGHTTSNRVDENAGRVFARGRGNRLLVTRAALDSLGIHSRVAMIRPFSADPSRYRFPTPDLYTYAVLRVDTGAGHHLWLDQNLRTDPLGVLRPVHGGRRAMLLAQPGAPTVIVKTPASNRDLDAKTVQLTLNVDAKGNLEATGTERYTGFGAAMIREGIAQVDPARRKQVVESGLAQSFGALTLEKLSFEGDDPASKPGTPLVIHYAFAAKGWARRSGNQMVLPGSSLFPADLSRKLITVSSRKLPMLLDTETTQDLEVSVHLPKGTTLAGDVGPAVSLDGPFGHYARTVKADGDTVRIHDVLALALTRVEPAAYRALAKFCAQVDTSQKEDLPVTLGKMASAAAPKKALTARR